MARRSNRSLTPSVCRLESREVLSRVSILAAHALGRLPAQVNIVPAATAGGSGANTGSGATGTSSSGGATPAAQAPTPQELAREAFAAGVTRIQVGESGPRFTDQLRQYLYAGSGSANQMKSFRLVMRLYVQADGSVTGLASLRNRDVATTGTNLILDLTGAAADVDAGGRPTHLTFTVDGNSGGYYAGATSVNADGSAGVGTLDLFYGPNPLHPPHGGGVNAGLANATIKGLIQTNNGVSLVTVNELGHF